MGWIHSAGHVLDWARFGSDPFSAWRTSASITRMLRACHGCYGQATDGQASSMWKAEQGRKGPSPKLGPKFGHGSQTGPRLFWPQAQNMCTYFGPGPKIGLGNTPAYPGTPIMAYARAYPWHARAYPLHNCAYPSHPWHTSVMQVPPVSQVRRAQRQTPTWTSEAHMDVRN